MSIALRIIINAFLILGGFFAFAGTVGIIRMPDAFCRLQSSTNISTLGLLGVAAGALIYAIAVEQSASMAVRIAIVTAFTFLTNPVASHALCKGAYKHNIRPEKEMKLDAMREDEPHE